MSPHPLRRAVYAGSFDPPTNGHLWMIREAQALFDELIVAIGSNPDINTVNVNNRVQAILSRLPADVQRQGLVVQKRSSAILAFFQFYSTDPALTPRIVSNYVTLTVLDAIARSMITVTASVRRRSMRLPISQPRIS